MPRKKGRTGRPEKDEDPIKAVLDAVAHSAGFMYPDKWQLLIVSPEMDSGLDRTVQPSEPDVRALDKMDEAQLGVKLYNLYAEGRADAMALCSRSIEDCAENAVAAVAVPARKALQRLLFAFGGGAAENESLFLSKMVEMFSGKYALREGVDKVWVTPEGKRRPVAGLQPQTVRLHYCHPVFAEQFWPRLDGLASSLIFAWSPKTFAGFLSAVNHDIRKSLPRVDVPDLPALPPRTLSEMERAGRGKPK